MFTPLETLSNKRFGKARITVLEGIFSSEYFDRIIYVVLIDITYGFGPKGLIISEYVKTELYNKNKFKYIGEMIYKIKQARRNYV